jgi:predicted anti-sigma-YlaC factor YlaD
MNDQGRGCPTEEQLLQAISTDELPKWTEHIGGCSECQALIAVVEVIRYESHLAQGQARPPSTQWILFQAEMRKRRAAAATVTLPLKMVKRLAFLAGLVVIMVVWYSVGSGVTSWREGLSTGSNQPAPVLFLAAASVPAFFVMALVLRTLWAED